MTDEEEPSCSICGELYDDPIMFWNNHLVTTSCGPLIKKRMETNNQQLPPPTMDEIRATCTVRLHDSRLFCCICQETFPKMPLSWYHVQTSALHQRVVMWEDRTRAQLRSPTGVDGASFQSKERRTDPLFVEYQKTLPVVQQKALAFLRKQYPYQENKDDGCMTDDDDDCDDADDDHNSAVPCVSRKRPRGESDDGDAVPLSKDAVEAMSYLAPPLFLKQGQIAVDPFPWYALGDSFRSPFQMPPRLGRTGQRLDWFEESAPEGISNRELAEETKQRLLTLRVVEKSQEAPLKVNDRWCDVCGKVFNESGWHAHMNDLSHRNVWDSDRWERTPNPATIIDETPPPPPPPATASAVSKSVPQVVKAPTPSAVKVPLSAPIRIAMNPPKVVAPSSTLPASSHPTNTSVRPLTTPPPSSIIEQRKVLSQTVVQRPIRPPNAPPNPIPARSSTAPQSSASSTPTATRAPATLPPPPPPLPLRAKAVAQPPLPPLPSTKRPIASPFSVITKMPPAAAAAPVAPTPSAVPTPALVGSVRCADCGLLYPNTTDGRALHMISVKHQDALNQQRQNQELLNSGLKPADLLRPGEEKYVRVLGNTFSYICTLCSVQVQGHETWLKHAGGGNHQQKWDAALQRERMASMPLPSPSPGAAAPAMYPQPPAPSQPSFSMSSIPGVHSSEHNTLTAAAPAPSQMSGFYLRPPGAPPVAPPPQQQQRNVVEPPQAPYTGNEYPALHDVPHYRNNPASSSDRYAEREPHRYEEVDRGDRYRQQREQPLESRDRRDYYDDPQRYRDSRDSTSYSTSRSGGSAGGYERSPTTTTYHHHHVEHDRGSKRFEEDVYYRRRAEESDRSHVGSSSSALSPPPPAAAAGSTHSSSHQPTTDTHRRYSAPSSAPPPSTRGPPLGSASASSSSAHHQLMPPPPGMDEEEEEDAPTGSWSMNSLPGVKGSEANKLSGGVLRKKNGKVIEKVTPKYVATAKGAPPAAGYLRPPGK